MRLTAQADKLPGQISGGQQQRVAIARAIVVEPPLVLMDEPLSNLDAKLRLEMRAEIRRIHTLLGCATIYVTHDQDEALSLADRIVVLRDGEVRQIGTPGGAVRAGPRMPMSRSSWATATWCRRTRTPTATSLPVTVGGAALMRRRRSSRCAADAAIVAIRPEDLAPIGRRADHGDGGDRRVSRPRFLRRRRRRRTGRAVLPLRGAGACRAKRCASAPIPRGCWSIAESVEALSASRCGMRLAQRGLDGVTCWCCRRCCSSLALFIYPFLYGLLLSFIAEGRAAGWRTTRSSSPIRSSTTPSGKTLWIAVPVTLLNVAGLGPGRAAGAADAATSGC